MALGDVLQSFSGPGDGLRGMAWDGTDLWTVSLSDALIYRLDPSDGSVLQSFSMPGTGATGQTWDGTDLWHADRFDQTIYRLDPSDGSTLQSFTSPGSNPQGLAWDGTDLWNADQDTDTIYRLDPSDGSVLQSFSSPETQPGGLTWDGTDLWVDQISTIYRISTSDGSVFDSLATPTSPGGLTWDGTDLWMSGTPNDPPTIYRLDATNAAPTADAGADQAVNESDTVNLDGTGSSDPEGRALSYEWTVQDDGGTGLVDGDISNRLTDSASFTAPEVVGPDANIVIQLEVTDDTSNTDTDTVTITVSDTNAFIDHTGTGGLVLGGAAPSEFQRFMLIEHTGSGGLMLGGDGAPKFTAPQVASDIVVECDWDNDGDFDEPEEDITSFVLALETRTGRDWPSLLTGKAGPGQLRCTLDNNDNRFNFYNTDSPLNSGSFSMRTGRKVRVRTVGSADPDPQLLARDRFNRPAFASGGPITWTQPVGIWNTTDGDTVAGATSTDQEHIAVTDVGVDDYYAQVTIHTAGRDTDNVDGNVLGLVYRYQDSSNYSLAVLVVDVGILELSDVVGGSLFFITSFRTEIYDQMTVGVLVAGDSVTLYQEGVAVVSDTAIQAGETQVGMYAFWGVGADGAQQPRPELDDFYVWTGLPTEVEGILWTGNVSDLISDVKAGSLKLARMEGRGVLVRPAGQSISPTRSDQGRRTGLLVGNTLAQAGLLHPPCTEIEHGDVTTGPVAIDEIQAMEALRRFEEAEFGFIKESNEGYICYESRTARNQATPQAVLSDASGAQLAYHHVEPKDWRREIFNRVRSGLSPRSPAEITVTDGSFDQAFNAAQRFEVVMPSTVNAGDLLIVAASASSGIGGQPEEWFIPPGWSELTGKDLRGQDFDPYDDSRVYVKVADGTEGGSQIAFAETTESTQNGSGVAHIFRIPEGQWYGDLAGVHLGGQGIASSDAPALLVPWALRPTLFIAFRWGIEGSSITEGTPEPPIGYENVSILTEQDQDADSGIQSASKIDVVTLEDPSQWFGTYTGWAQVDSGVIAIRAAERGDPVQSDAVDSQDEHNAIKTYQNTANLFATEADAETYNNLVLGRHADDRPIVAVSFWATKHAALRAQAIRRRVSDMITLQAANKAGLGIDDDFYIESINHRWSKGTTLWETTWELSPAPARFIASSGDSSGSDSVTVAEPDGATTGDILIGEMWSREDPGSAPSGWTQIGSTLQVGDDYGSVWMIERGPSAPDLTWTNSSPNPLMMVGVLAYRGFSATPVDTATSAAGSQTSPSVTATDTGQWLLSVYHDAGTGLPVTHPSGMTLRYDGALDQESFVADQIAVDSGPTGTRSWSDGNTALGCWSLILNTL